MKRLYLALLYLVAGSELAALKLDTPAHIDDLSKLDHTPKTHFDRYVPLGRGEVPDYALDYAPLIHLYSEEAYLPCDIAEFVTHFHAETQDGAHIPGSPPTLAITDLSLLPSSSFLVANDDFDSLPDWISGVHNVPLPINGSIKNAPATIIAFDKGDGWVDVFYFYFYAFNLGPFVMGTGPYGNHIGDWEHSLVRFYDGEPVIVWMSAHGGGGAYRYRNVEKSASGRPVLFSARGTHANYVSVGQHPHDLPYGILSDFTDRGPLWDPAQNYLGYTFDGDKAWPTVHNRNFHHQGREIQYGDWLAFMGRWGNPQLQSTDSRQRYFFLGGYKYIDGPTGPLTKHLDREGVCQRHKWWNVWGLCQVRRTIKWGIGIEHEGSNCGVMVQNIRPVWLRTALMKITYGGGLCWLMDLLYG